MWHLPRALALLLSMSAQAVVINVAVTWTAISAEVNTIPTYQIVANPELRRGRRMHNSSFEAAAMLNATLVRYVPWYPYPALAVAELSPPTNHSTSWNFTVIDPLMEDVMDAVTNGGKKDKKALINFSTTPGWMWEGGWVLNASTIDPDARNSGNPGVALRDPSAKELADYYARLISWYTRGGFTDEVGIWHPSPHHYPITYWEILNEPQYEHGVHPELYTAIYDAVVKAVRQVVPGMTFVGGALGSLDHTWASFFLNSSNHDPAALPLDWFSFHYYCGVPSTSNATDFENYFGQADGVLVDIAKMMDLKAILAPHVKTDMNEVGAIQNIPGWQIPDLYWNAANAFYTYMFAKVGLLGVNAIGCSTLAGYPAIDGFSAEFPTVSMMDWNQPRPTARLWGLKLLIDTFGSDLESAPYVAHPTAIDSTDVYAQAYSQTPSGRVVLLINKKVDARLVNVPGASGHRLRWVDGVTSYGPPGTAVASGDLIALNPFGVAIVFMD